MASAISRITNKICTIDAEAPATPEKPNAAAIIAAIKNKSTQYNTFTSDLHCPQLKTLYPQIDSRRLIPITIFRGDRLHWSQKIMPD